MTRPDRHTGVASVRVERVAGSLRCSSSDELSVEEPLQVRLISGNDGRVRPLAVTMRTPGDDEALAVGFLVTEGIIHDRQDVEDVRPRGRNAVEVRLRPGIETDPSRLDRHSFASSSCGVCGKRTIEAVRVAVRHRVEPGRPRVDPEVIHDLPAALRLGQSAFARTGGIHASGLFDPSGRLLAVHEDVGRHNALDKLIGAEFLADRLPLAGSIVLVSGRVGFELVQKAAIAGTAVLGSVGAPSSLAVDLAQECGLTLIGFVRDARFNVYADAGRITDANHALQSPETTDSQLQGTR